MAAAGLLGPDLVKWSDGLTQTLTILFIHGAESAYDCEGRKMDCFGNLRLEKGDRKCDLCAVRLRPPRHILAPPSPNFLVSVKSEMYQSCVETASNVPKDEHGVEILRMC